MVSSLIVKVILRGLGSVFLTSLRRDSWWQCLGVMEQLDCGVRNAAWGVQVDSQLLIFFLIRNQNSEIRNYTHSSKRGYFS